MIEIERDSNINEDGFDIDLHDIYVRKTKEYGEIVIDGFEWIEFFATDGVYVTETDNDKKKSYAVEFVVYFSGSDSELEKYKIIENKWHSEDTWEEIVPPKRVYDSFIKWLTTDYYTDVSLEAYESYMAIDY